MEQMLISVSRKLHGKRTRRRIRHVGRPGSLCPIAVNQLIVRIDVDRGIYRIQKQHAGAIALDPERNRYRRPARQIPDGLRKRDLLPGCVLSGSDPDTDIPHQIPVVLPDRPDALPGASDLKEQRQKQNRKQAYKKNRLQPENLPDPGSKTVFHTSSLTLPVLFSPDTVSPVPRMLSAHILSSRLGASFFHVICCLSGDAPPFQVPWSIKG